jgi:hypothetical protein
MSKEIEDADIQRVQKHIDALREFFDTVQVFCSRQEPDDTISVQMGSGNWHARYGQVSEWLLREEQRSRNKARREDQD